MKRFMRLSLTILVGLYFALEAAALAQERGRWGEFRPEDMLARMDANGNGQIDVDEMQGRAHYFLERLAPAAGLDLSKPIPLDKLKAAIQQQFSGGPPAAPSSGSSAGSAPGSPPVAAPKPKSVAERMAFGVAENRPLVLGFGDPASGAPTVALATKYDADVMRRVKERFDEYDRNKDDFIDSEEWQRGRWDPPATERDKNKDGRLTREELAEHYQNRARGGSSSGRGGPPASGSTPTAPPTNGGFSGGGFFGVGGPPFGGGSFGSPTSSAGATFSAAPSSTAASTSKPADSSAPSDRTVAYAEGLIKSYDENKDGILQKTEWSKMRGDYSAADKNGDGNLTKDELVERLSSQSRGGGSASAKPASSPRVKTYRFLAPTERLPKGLPSWFADKDQNKDGQVLMSEYASAWTDSAVAEFAKLDTNGDGVITAREALATAEKKEK